MRANSKLLIVDDTQGLIVAAAAERMGGYGTIVGVHDGDNHNFDVVRYMNFPKRIQNTIHTIPLARLDPNDPNGKQYSNEKWSFVDVFTYSFYIYVYEP